MRRIITLIFILLVAIGGLVVLFGQNEDKDTAEKNNNKGYLRITISPKAALPVELVDSSGSKIYELSQETSSVSLPVGKNNYGIKRSGFDDVFFEVELYNDVSVVKEVALVSQQNSIENNILTSLSSPGATISLDNGYWIKNAQYHENNTWASGVLITTDRQTEGEQIIVKLVGNDWEIVYAGTGFDTVSLVNSNVPQSVIDWVTE